MRIEVDPDVLVQSGQKLGSIGSQLGMLASALGEALGSGIASGMDPAGADFGIKYGHQAQDFAKGMADATDAHEAVGFMLQATGYNYKNADAASTIGGSGPTGRVGAPPDKSTAADAKGVNGVMVPPPAKWALIQTFLGPMWSWPSGNASMMRITAAQWRNFANGLAAFDGEMSNAKGAVSQQRIPEAGKIGDALTDLTEGVKNLAESATAMAKAIDDFASGVQDTQDAIRDLMDRISLDGLWDTVTGFLTGDGDDVLREVADDVKQLLKNFQSQVKGVVGLLGELASLLGSAADAFEKWVRPILVEALGDDVGNAAADYVTWNVDVGVGAVTGLINTVSGVVSLADLDTWKGLADVAQSVVEDPTKLPGVMENMGKEFVAWDKWSDDHPGRAAGEAAFNIGTLFVPGGALAEGGGVAKSLSYASRLFEEGRLPHISDLPGLGGGSHGLPGLEDVPGAGVPNIPEFHPGAVPDSIVSPSAPNGIDVPTSPASAGGPGGSTGLVPAGGHTPRVPATSGPGSGDSPRSSEPSAPDNGPSADNHTQHGASTPTERSAVHTTPAPADSPKGRAPVDAAPPPAMESPRPATPADSVPSPEDSASPGTRQGVEPAASERAMLESVTAAHSSSLEQPGGYGETRPVWSNQEHGAGNDATHDPNSPPPSHHSGGEGTGSSDGGSGPDGRVKFSGHGSYDSIDGETVIPEGSSVTVYAEHGSTITDGLGNLIETGGETSHVFSRTFHAGEAMPNYTLHPPDGLDIQGAPWTVDTSTRLSEMLRANMGDIDFAACLYDPSSPTNLVYDAHGVWDETQGQLTHIYESPEVKGSWEEDIIESELVDNYGESQPFYDINQSAYSQATSWDYSDIDYDEF